MFWGPVMTGAAAGVILTTVTAKVWGVPGQEELLTEIVQVPAAVHRIWVSKVKDVGPEKPPPPFIDHVKFPLGLGEAVYLTEAPTQTVEGPDMAGPPHCAIA